MKPASSTQTSTAAQSDVFLSHASEDKDEIARPLREALEDRGLVVWFDEVRIKVGQGIRQEIEKGIAGAKFGVVILSPSFFAKQWTQAELDALFTKKVDTGRSVILPIWHRVTKDEVAAHSPLLAGLLALNSATMTLTVMASLRVRALACFVLSRYRVVTKPARTASTWALSRARWLRPRGRS